MEEILRYIKRYLSHIVIMLFNNQHISEETLWKCIDRIYPNN